MFIIKFSINNMTDCSNETAFINKVVYELLYIFCMETLIGQVRHTHARIRMPILLSSFCGRYMLESRHHKGTVTMNEI